MPRADIIVTEARSWVGTPFRHHGRIKGRACDCCGLIVGVANNLKISDFDFFDYGRDPSHIDIVPLLRSHLNPVDVNFIQEGDIVHLRWGQHPRHLAIVTDRLFDDDYYNIVHAYEPQKKVIEHIFDKKWKNRLIGAWRYRDKD